MEAGVQGHVQLHSESESNLGCRKLVSKKDEEVAQGVRAFVGKAWGPEVKFPTPTYKACVVSRNPRALRDRSGEPLGLAGCQP